MLQLWLLISGFSTTAVPLAEVGIPQYKTQSATNDDNDNSAVAKRLNKLLLVIAQLTLRFKRKKVLLALYLLCELKKSATASALLRCEL